MAWNARKIFICLILLVGLSLSIITEFKTDSPNIWYVLWTIFPYVSYYFATFKAKSIGAIIGGGILVLGVDIFIHIQVFYLPGSSTDSIALITMPFWQSIIIMPTGFLLGWIIEKLSHYGRNKNG